MTIRLLEINDKDYPLIMNIVPNKEKYDLFKIDDLVVVPLMQVIDAIALVKSDVTIRNGIRYCSNCGAEMVEPQESEDK